MMKCRVFTFMTPNAKSANFHLVCIEKMSYKDDDIRNKITS